jgi:hypothetical protein
MIVAEPAVIGGLKSGVARRRPGLPRALDFKPRRSGRTPFFVVAFFF